MHYEIAKPAMSYETAETAVKPLSVLKLLGTFSLTVITDAHFLDYM